ncbi:MAG: hypothetical protein JW741_29030 [Sedimentisphaerales bacterium]|nr:hypothetical protein [Sedimentisphaerales bacterium]
MGLKGLSKLETKGSLQPKDEGFRQLSDIVMGRLRGTNSAVDFGVIRVERLDKWGSISQFGQSTGFAAMAILTDGTEHGVTSDMLRMALDHIRSRDVFRWMAALLFIGIAFIEIPTIAVQVLEGRVKKAKRPKLLSHVPPM